MEDKQKYPFITIVIPVRNEEKYLNNTIVDLLQQDYPKERYEIIVADGESDDSTPKIVENLMKENPQIMLKTNPKKLSSSGRNVGFKNGKGDIFLVIDGHCKIINRQLLKNLAEGFEKSGAQCLGRPQPFIIPSEPTMEKAIALARGSWLGHSVKSYIHSNQEGFVSPVSVGCAYRREVFEAIGYVDESFDACEDVEFNYRVEKRGLSAYFSPGIAVYYFARKDIKGLWKQLNRYGMGRWRLIFKHPEMLDVHTFLPLFFLIGVLAGPITWFMKGPLFTIYMLSMLAYLGIIAGEGLRLSKGEGIRFFLKISFAFITIHLSLGMGLLRGAIFSGVGKDKMRRQLR